MDVATRLSKAARAVRTEARRWTARGQRVVDGLPRPLRRLVVGLGFGLVGDPIDRAREWSVHARHRKPLGRLWRALLYQRYSTGLVLAHEVGVFAALTEPLTAAQVAERCATHERATETLLRIVEGLGAVARTGERYALTPFGAAYLAPDGAHSLAPILELAAAQTAAFPEVVKGLSTGQVPSALDVFSLDSRYRAFLEAVNAYLAMATEELLLRCQLPELRSIIVGSMGVSFSAVLLDAYPEARVTYGCLEHLVAEVPSLMVRYGVDESRVEGIHAHSGEPEGERWGHENYDLVLLTRKMILEPSARIGERFATKAFSVLRPGGVAVLWETVHPADRPSSVARAVEAVLDLSASPTAPLSTDAGLEAMLRRIGFASVELVPCLEGATTFVVARKA